MIYKRRGNDTLTVRLLLLQFHYSAQPNAELVERDWNTEGDGLITLDTVSKKWLDLTVTDEMSINSVSELLSTTYAGWDLATQSDIDELMEGYFEYTKSENHRPAGQQTRHEQDGKIIWHHWRWQVWRFVC